VNIEEYKHFDKSEQLVSILKKKNQSKEEHFFRVLVGYYFSKITSIMRTNIDIPSISGVPVNMYSMCLLPSGAGKGKSTNFIENEVLEGFKNKFLNELFPKVVDKNLADIAVTRSTKYGTDPDEEYVKIQQEFKNTGAYYFNFDSGTAPAVKQLRHQLLLAGIGSINLEMDEVGANFSNNIEILNTFIELYDLGRVKNKITKNTKENKRDEQLFGSTPANILLFGTPTKLLDGGKTEQDFYDMLEMGYARRLFFSYTSKVDNSTDMTPEELLEMIVDSSTDLFTENLKKHLEKLADKEFFNKTLTANKEVVLRLLKYKQFCEKRASSYKEHEEMKKAEMVHRYFKAIKLAGAYAFIDESFEIEMKHLESAIKLAEESGNAFEKLLKRDKPYVKLAKYVADIGKEVTHVDLVEDLPFYKGSITQKKELLDLAVAWGYNNNIIIKKSLIDGIEFFKGESLPVTDLNKIILSGSKDITYNYENSVITWEQLSKFVVMPNLHWTTHHWKEGHRSKSNLIPNFNLVVLDIDKDLKLDIARELLAEYQYIIYTTKRHTEEHNRFRIILPLSHELSLGSEEYSKFMENVFNWLPFEVDDATKDVARKWLTNPGKLYMNEGKLLDAMQFIPKTKKSEELSIERQKISNMSNIQAWFYRQIQEGNRNNTLLKYGMLLADNGYDINSIRNELINFNSKLVEPLDPDEINSTIMITITKKLAEEGKL
jgi:hypothetical protein